MKPVLVVAENSIQREAVAALLDVDHLSVTAVATADAALASLRKATFDSVVLDLGLDRTGSEFLVQMSAVANHSLPPIIVCSARALAPDEEHELRLLSKSIIMKTVRSPEQLLAEVTLFSHCVESELPPNKQRMLQVARDRAASFEGRRILLVEDDVRNVFALSSVLQSKGATVEIARNGNAALAMLHEDPTIDVTLMDIMMPEMDGIEATRRIRENGKWDDLPIIALTAKATSDDRQQCLAAGANDYIAKPIDVEALLSLLRVWMPK
jgi:CheY-like chemotaxis protein